MAGRPPDDDDCGGYRVLTNTGRVLSGAVWRGVNSNQNPASRPEAGIFFFTFEKNSYTIIIATCIICNALNAGNSNGRTIIWGVIAAGPHAGTSFP